MNQSSETLLKNNLRHTVESRIYTRGMGYYRSGHIQSLRVFLFASSRDKIEIRGEVMGTNDYKSSLVFDLQERSFEDLDCNCPYGSYCKHSVALGLKFIELFHEFLEQAVENNQEVNNNNLRRKLTSWINNQKLGQEYGFDEYDEERDYLVEDEDEIIEGEFEDIGNDFKKMSKEELMNELTKEISSGNTAGEVVDELIREIASREATSKIDKSKNSVVALPENKTFKKRQPSFLPKAKFEKEEFNASSFYILIKQGYDDRISDIVIKKNNHTAAEIDIFLEEYKNLTEAQEELFRFLKPLNFYYSKFNYQELFELLRDSGIKVFWDRKIKTQELIFREDRDNKIKVELNLKSEINEYSGESKEKFVFKLDSDYKNSGLFLLFFDKAHLVQIEDQEVSFHKLSKLMLGLLSRISLDKYEYYGSKSLETVLGEEEIIKIDQIIKDGFRYLDFKTNLKSDFQIKKFTSAEPCIVIDYDNKKDSLKIQATIDYGAGKIDVGESVRRYHSRGENYIERWDNSKYVIKAGKEKIEYALVKSKKEVKLYQQFYYFGKECGFTKNLKCEFNGEKEIFKYLSKHWQNLKNLNYKIEFIHDEFQFVEENFEAGFDVGLDAENDWLGFDVNCYCGEDQISLDDLRKYIEDKKEFIKLNNGRILKITNREELERFVLMLESFYAKENNKFEGKLYHAPELEDIFTSSKYYNAKVEKSFNKFIQEAKSGKPVRKVKLPIRFSKVLRDYQKDGINWFYFLRKYRFAGILADDMGLGKTLQALVLMEKEKVKNKPSIVICPKTLLYNWQNEMEKFTPRLKTIIIDGFPEERKKLIKNAKQYDLIITGYATMQKDCEIYNKQKIKFNYCVLDEAQFIKNHITKNAQIVKKINADYRLALTGTPLENSVSEIWSIFDFLMPGFLGSYNAFHKKFQKPIMKDGDALALKNLRKKTECFMLRRAKKEVLKELPPKIEQVSRCHLEKAQNILYQEILANVKSEIFETVKNKGFNKSRIHILAGLIKLRQVCNHPVLLLKDKDYTKYESAKLNMFVELIDEIIGNKRKVLVFSQFTQMLDILAEELNKNKINYSYLSGKTKKRQEVINDFNENKNKQVFLISLRAGGVGLNLTSADNVIIFDPWWNPSVENQAIDRAHRIGQKNSVNVYRLITEGTIEERIVKLQEKKKFLFDNLVGESKDLFTKLTWDDIQGLFR
ncbi:MAG: DEAD/DEAH box helicase family protein [Candidatus Pacebacteria bacterium]|nr:DEAD/DEAH box helicase family protein [Candidatus Paceibacterota bacterium]